MEAPEELGRYDEGQAGFDAVIARFGDAAEDALRREVALAYRNKASFLVRADRPDDALAASAELVRRFGDDPLPAIRRDVAHALHERSGVLTALDRRDEALAALGDIVARYSGDDDPELHRCVGCALTDTADLVHASDPDAAMAALDELLARFGGRAELDSRILVAAALARRGRYLEHHGRPDEALATYRRLRDDFPPGESPYVDRHVAYGMRRAAALATRPGARLRRRLRPK